MASEAVVLRYFPVCGRAQALRHALADSGTHFEDLRLPLAEWATRRTDPAFSGRHRALPTLSWGGAFVAETLPIASFLAKRLGHYQGLDDVAVGACEAIISSAYTDVTLRLVEVIRADLLHPGADPVRSLAMALPQVLQKCEILDAELTGGAFIGGDRPTIPDFFVAEAIEALRYVLGPSHEAWLEGTLPRSHDLAARLRARPGLVDCWRKRPTNFTARLGEDQVVARLRVARYSETGTGPAPVIGSRPGG
ncbi:MAG: glutathione S-transferase C-terminal domain-containing protein [Polyangiaceae bacterium]